MEVLEELEVAFFLSWDKMVNQHRALSGDRFMHGGPASFSDHEVMFIQELRDFFCPTQQADAVRILRFDFCGTRVEGAEILPSTIVR